MKQRGIIEEISEVFVEDDEITFDKAVKMFIADRVRRELSEDTIKYYRQKLSLFKKRHYEIYGRSICRCITINNIRDYVDYHTIDLGNKMSSAYACLRAVKAYCTFLVDRGLAESNPFDDYVLSKPKVKEINTFTKEQLNRLMAQPNLKRFAGLRDYTIMSMMLDTGIRVRELHSLDVDDIHFEDSYISVKGKNGHLRNIPISIQLRQVLRKYLRVRGASPSTALFISCLDTRISRRTIQERIELYGKKANINNVRVSPHTFRHTFAKMYVQNGGNIFVLQDILGHQTLEMVRVYVRLFTNDLYDDHKRNNPLSYI